VIYLLKKVNEFPKKKKVNESINMLRIKFIILFFAKGKLNSS